MSNAMNHLFVRVQGLFNDAGGKIPPKSCICVLENGNIGIHFDDPFDGVRYYLEQELRKDFGLYHAKINSGFKKEDCLGIVVQRSEKNGK